MYDELIRFATGCISYAQADNITGELTMTERQVKWAADLITAQIIKATIFFANVANCTQPLTLLC
jgi:hypothetical protein